MTHQVKVKPVVKRELSSLPYRDKLRILAVLATLQSRPLAGKKLLGKFSALYTIKVWPYRIVYKILPEYSLVLVVRISNRK
jgi:mRNA-degrading endonuclease RelE of RelBE toxin-antitoxin system